jgi:hypothetical protein
MTPRLVTVLVVIVLLGGASCEKTASTGTASPARQASTTREPAPPPTHSALPPQTGDWPTYSSAEYGYSLRYPPQWFDLPNFGPPSEHYFSDDKSAGSPMNMALGAVFVGVSADCQYAVGRATLISEANLVADSTPTVRYVVRSSGPDGTLFAAVATVEPGALCYRVSMLGWSQAVIESHLVDFDLMLETVRFSARSAPVATPVATQPPGS